MREDALEVVCEYNEKPSDFVYSEPLLRQKYLNPRYLDIAKKYDVLRSELWWL